MVALSKITSGIIAALLTTFVSSETIELRGGKEIEFQADLEQGQNWGVQYQIVEGSIGFRLTSPDGVIFEGPAETYGSYSLTAKSLGMHSFKFINSDEKGTPVKKISFTVLGSGEEGKEGKKLDPVQNELKELNAGLRLVYEEHSFLMEREEKHRKIAESTNARVMWWFVMQIIVLSAVCYFQISSLKKFFEVRRLV